MKAWWLYLIEYNLDGAHYVCKIHYRKLYLKFGKHLPKIKSPVLGLCVYCKQENEKLAPVAKVFPIISLSKLKERVHGIIGSSIGGKRTYDEGLQVMPDGHIRWVFPKFMALRADQQAALKELVADPAKYLVKLEQDWRSNRWTLTIFRKSLPQALVKIRTDDIHPPEDRGGRKAAEHVFGDGRD